MSVITRLNKSLLGPLLIAILSLLLYSINIDRLTNHDEIYHILAAEGLLATGEPSIGENGRYWRGYPLTWLVAQSFTIFGPTLAAARLPSIITTVVMVAALFLFLRKEANNQAAWIGASLFAVSPFALNIAQFVRFYSLQCLTFFLGAWLVYHVMTRPWSIIHSGVFVTIAASLLLIAVYLQPTTLFGIGGLGLWVVGMLLLPWLFDSEVALRVKVRLVSTLVAAGVIVLGVAWITGTLEALWISYRTVPIFNEPAMNRFWVYHAWYQLYYPTLWTLSGIIFIFALIANPKVTTFVAVVFLVGFLMNSFAAPKSLRYIAYAQPFLFALWGIGLAAIIKSSAGLFTWLSERLTPHFTWFAGAQARTFARAFVVVAALFTVLVNPAWLRSVTMLADITVPPQMPRNDWLAAKSILQPWIDGASVFVTTDELGPLYYYGRADILLQPSKFYELGDPDRKPFTPDPRTDVPTITTAADLALVIDCYSSGLFLTLSKWWAGDESRTVRHMRDLEVESLVETRADSLPLPRESHLVAYVWEHSTSFSPPAKCSSLPTMP
jgi:hypothetical protein